MIDTNGGGGHPTDEGCGTLGAHQHGMKRVLSGTWEWEKLPMEDAYCYDGAWCAVLEQPAFFEEVPLIPCKRFWMWDTCDGPISANC